MPHSGAPSEADPGRDPRVGTLGAGPVHHGPEQFHRKDAGIDADRHRCIVHQLARLARATGPERPVGGVAGEDPPIPEHALPCRSGHLRTPRPLRPPAVGPKDGIEIPHGLPGTDRRIASVPSVDDEDLGDEYRAEVLGHPQLEVEVLTGVEHGAEPSGDECCASPHHHRGHVDEPTFEHAEIVDRHLILRSGARPSGVLDLDGAVAQGGIGSIDQGVELADQSMGRGQVVVIEEGHEVGTTLEQSGVPGRRYPPMSATDHPDSGGPWARGHPRGPPIHPTPPRSRTPTGSGR